jgi:hypothetical protein
MQEKRPRWEVRQGTVKVTVLLLKKKTQILLWIPTRTNWLSGMALWRLVEDYERLPASVVGLHFVAFACLFLQGRIAVILPSSQHLLGSVVHSTRAYSP